MILADYSGNIYKAHFRHIRHSAPVKNPKTRDGYEIGYTECSLHAGSCLRPERPCGTSSFHAEAHCSSRDHFNRAVGIKTALAGALKYLPKDIRRQLWGSYLKQFEPEHVDHFVKSIGA